MRLITLTEYNKNHYRIPVIAREARLWQSIRDYGIFRRLPQSFLLRNDGVSNKKEINHD